MYSTVSWKLMRWWHLNAEISEICCVVPKSTIILITGTYCTSTTHLRTVRKVLVKAFVFIFVCSVHFPTYINWLIATSLCLLVLCWRPGVENSVAGITIVKSYQELLGDSLSLTLREEILVLQEFSCENAWSHVMKVCLKCPPLVFSLALLNSKLRIH